MAKRKSTTKRKNKVPTPITARKVKGGVTVSVKVKSIADAKKIARRLGAK